MPGKVSEESEGGWINGQVFGSRLGRRDGPDRLGTWAAGQARLASHSAAGHCYAVQAVPGFSRRDQARCGDPLKEGPDTGGCLGNRG